MLNKAEHCALDQIRAQVLVQKLKFKRDEAAGLFESLKKDYPNLHPSEWVFATEMHNRRVYMVTLRSLVRKGFLEEQPTDGFGPQFRLSTSGSAPPS